MSGKEMTDLGMILIAFGAIMVVFAPLMIHFIIKRNNTY